MDNGLGVFRKGWGGDSFMMKIKFSVTIFRMVNVNPSSQGRAPYAVGSR